MKDCSIYSVWIQALQQCMIFPSPVFRWQSLSQGGGEMHCRSHAAVGLCKVVLLYNQLLHTYMVSLELTFWWWSARLQQAIIRTENFHLRTCVRMSGGYLPVSLQSGHWCWQFGHLFLRWWSRSWRKILTSLPFSMHSFGQQRISFVIELEVIVFYLAKTQKHDLYFMSTENEVHWMILLRGYNLIFGVGL